MPTVKGVNIITSAVITSWDGQLYSLHRVIESARESVDVIICGYDLHNELPNVKTIKMCDYFFVIGTGNDKWDEMRVKTRMQIGEVTQLQQGIELAAKYSDFMVKLEGDVAIRRPQIIRPYIKRFLKNYDISLMSRKGESVYGTTIFFGGTRVLNDIFGKLTKQRRPRIERQLFNVITKINNYKRSNKIKIHNISNDEFATMGFCRVKKYDTVV